MTERWDCLGCKAVLGYIEDKRIIRIKRKDLYVEIEGGKVSTPCYRCGKINSLSYDKDRYFLEGKKSNPKGGDIQ